MANSSHSNTDPRLSLELCRKNDTLNSRPILWPEQRNGLHAVGQSDRSWPDYHTQQQLRIQQQVHNKCLRGTLYQHLWINLNCIALTTCVNADILLSHFWTQKETNRQKNIDTHANLCRFVVMPVPWFYNIGSCCFNKIGSSCQTPLSVAMEAPSLSSLV